MVRISVIITTYDRFEPLQVALQSVLSQSLPNDVTWLEIIVLNDGSTDPRYYQTTWPPGVTVVHQQPSTRQLLGFPCVGWLRNRGLRMSCGDYVCFLDDDDAFLPLKLYTQLQTMREQKVWACSTEALLGHGTYRNTPSGLPLHTHIHQNLLKHKWGVTELPARLDKALLQKHNAIITSSVMIHKALLQQVGWFRDDVPMGGAQGIYEDWDLWLRVAEVTPWLWLHTPLVYYDGQHAQKQNYTVL